MDFWSYSAGLTYSLREGIRHLNAVGLVDARRRLKWFRERAQPGQDGQRGQRRTGWLLKERVWKRNAVSAVPFVATSLTCFLCVSYTRQWASFLQHGILYLKCCLRIYLSMYIFIMRKQCQLWFPMAHWHDNAFGETFWVHAGLLKQAPESKSSLSLGSRAWRRRCQGLGLGDVTGHQDHQLSSFQSNSCVCLMLRYLLASLLHIGFTFALPLLVKNHF